MAMAPDLRQLLAVGLSHNTAPVEVRERIAFDDQGIRTALDALQRDVTHEALLLSTCNRTELYAIPHSEARVREWLHSFRGPQGERLDRYLYWRRGRAAVNHLFRVASSLDSLVVGEPQILGQVKAAVRVAREQNTLGDFLQPLADRSFTVAKRVRSETAIGRNRVGIGNAGVDLALQIFGGLSGKRAMLLGVGEMGQQVARALLNSGLDDLMIANRTYERAVDLAREHGATAVRYERLAEYLPLADIVLVATGAPEPVLVSGQVRAALRARRYRTMFLIDLAVPRNVEPSVGDIDEAFLFDIDDLVQVVQRGQEARNAEADRATLVVDEETERFVKSMRRIDVSGVLRRMSDSAEILRLSEIERSKFVRDLAPEQRKALDVMSRSLVNKLLHAPRSSLRDASIQGDEQAVKILGAVWKEDD
jgi:glutamyl-tRNA reductase